MIRTYESRDFEGLHRLWNTAAAAQGYAPLEEPELKKLLTEHPYFSDRYAFVLEEDGEITGFVCGCVGADLPQGDKRGYFSCLFQKQERRETARQLLEALENAFRQAGKTQVAATFFNPIHLPWVIPGTPGHQHNNCPGIAEDLPLHGWMEELGYRVHASECAMYLNLADFRTPAWVAEKEEAARREGYSVDWYREGRHTGLDEMVHSLGNSMWNAEIPTAAREINMLVALCGNEVAGFTGPVYPEKTGRGYFAGIGVCARHERHGLGTLLFYRLCQAEKEAGSEYMSLFTGSSNHAQKIYLGAGFQVRRKFSVVTKEL